MISFIHSTFCHIYTLAELPMDILLMNCQLKNEIELYNSLVYIFYILSLSFTCLNESQIECC